MERGCLFSKPDKLGGQIPMPIYEYRCLKCKKEFEQIHKFSDPPLKKCPHCGGKVEKKVSLSSFQLKGTGWYATDYAKKEKSEVSSKTEDSGNKTTTKKN